MPDNRETGPAPGERLHPALALANSRRNSASGPIDELASTASLRSWLHSRGFAGRCRADDLSAFRELRDAVQELLLARIEGRTPDAARLALVNEAAVSVPSVPQLDWSGGEPVRVLKHLAASGPALVRGVIATDAIELAVGDADLRACAAPGCVRLLLRDHPRRTWCSTRCGDRVRASRYYHRHRAQAV